MISGRSRFYDFDPFRLDLKERLLLQSGKNVPLTPKAFDTLLMLVQNRSRIVEKDELLQNIWPETFVEEATLAQNIFTIRKALGGKERDEYIQTVPRRGYRFMAKVTEAVDESPDVSIDQIEVDSFPSLAGHSPDRTPHSVAVLPLIDETSDPAMVQLGDCITERVVNSLSLLPDLNIKACSTVRRYRGRDFDPQKVGSELGVQSVLIGRILQFAEDVLIRMELVDVDQGWQRWGEEYKDKISRLSAFQEAVARDISENLRAKLTSQMAQRPSNPIAHSSDAYQFYLQGRYALNTRTKEGNKKAIDCFEHAIEMDSFFALAYAGLADSYIRFDFYGLTSPHEAMSKARAAAIKAVQLDNELSEAHTSLGAVKLVCDRDAIGAELEFKRAIRLNPKSCRAHDGYAHCLTELDQVEEALAECKLALELEPLDLEINQHLGLHYLFARQPDLAIEQLQKTIALGPDFYRARILLGIAYGRKNQFLQAIAEFLRARHIEKTTVLSGFLGYAYAKAGQQEALNLLDELLEESKHEYVPPYCIALIYTGLGRQDEAIEWLQKAFVEHSHWRGWFSLIPELDSLRSDSRFTALLERRFKTAHF